MTSPVPVPRALSTACVLALLVPSLPARAATVCGNAYSVEPRELPRAHRLLGGVTAVSPSDAWVVGQDQDLEVPYRSHWNGVAWQDVSGPSPVGVGKLNAVFALSSSDVWAAGEVRVPPLPAPIFQHWDGLVWSSIPAAVLPPGTSGAALQGLSGIAPDDIWAVGWTTGATINDEVPHAEHWDGASWLAAPLDLPPTFRYGRATAVAALARDDVWAVGFWSDAVAGPWALLEHWDGFAWTRVSPPPSLGISRLQAVAAASANDVWAVGWAPAEGSLALHWDGSAWSDVPVAPGAFPEVLYSVVAVCGSDVRAFGSMGPTGPHAIVARWDGFSWCQEWHPPVYVECNQLFAAASIPGEGVWAVGDGYMLPPQRERIILHDATVLPTMCLQLDGTTGRVGNTLRAVKRLAGGVHLDWTPGALRPAFYNMHRQITKLDLTPPAGSPLGRATFVEVYDDTAGTGGSLDFYRVFGRASDGSSNLD